MQVVINDLLEVFLSLHFKESL